MFRDPEAHEEQYAWEQYGYLEDIDDAEYDEEVPLLDIDDDLPF